MVIVSLILYDAFWGCFIVISVTIGGNGSASVRLAGNMNAKIDKRSVRMSINGETGFVADKLIVFRIKFFLLIHTPKKLDILYL